jgi:hypothetical protein
VFGRAVRWRIPGTSPDLSFQDLLRQYPFVVLAHGTRWSVSGLCGRIWTLRRDYPSISGPQQFESWNEPGTVRVLLAHWVERDPAGSALVSETRVKPTDRRAGFRMRALWTVVGRFERFIDTELLSEVERRAELMRG